MILAHGALHRALYGRGEVEVEERPVDATDSAQVPGITSLGTNTAFLQRRRRRLISAGGRPARSARLNIGSHWPRGPMAGQPKPETERARRAGEVPLDGLRGRPSVELAAEVDEALDSPRVHVVDGGAVEDDGPEERLGGRRRRGKVLGVRLDRRRRRRHGLVPRTVARMVVVRRRCSAGRAGDVLDQAVDVLGLVEVVEPLGEAVDEDARVHLVDPDGWVGAIFTIEREEDVVCGGASWRRGRVVRKGLRAADGVTVRIAVVRVTVDAGPAEEAAPGPREAEKQQGRRKGDGDVDAVLEGGEEGHEDADEVDDDVGRRHEPRLEDVVRRGDEVDDGVDDEGGEAGHGDVVEHRRQGVQGEEQDGAVEEAGQGRPDAGLGQDGGAAERAGGGVGAEEGPEEVGAADGDELLGRLDSVVVDAAERLADGDVLDHEDDDGGREVRQQGRDQLRAQARRPRVREAPGQRAGDAEPVLAVRQPAVHQEADEGVEQDGEGHAQGAEHLPRAPVPRLPPRHAFAVPLDGGQQGEGRQPHGGVEPRARQAAGGVDEDAVGGGPGVDAVDAEEGGHLAQGDGDGGGGDEGRDGDVGDELDDPVEAEQAEDEEDGAGEEGERLGDLLGPELARVLLEDPGADFADEEGDYRRCLWDVVVGLEYCFCRLSD
ncbi:hypothetical protein ColKHC_03219 [Colletotrichum higginsianum]|nr:hypothetical protein ColKHC_03219 [Colletotrichum higginsianum]